jgi:hypothetical protein
LPCGSSNPAVSRGQPRVEPASMFKPNAKTCQDGA